MFGKTKDIADRDGDDMSSDGRELTVDQFFGDERAAEEAVRTEQLATRVQQVEQQLSSQFTSMAAYAQIAQEQVELARAEARNAVERSERRVTELIERERSDRMEATSSMPSRPSDGGASGDGGGWSDATSRIDGLERSIAEIRHGLDECLARQKALADAITALFEPRSTLPPPRADSPIAGLSID